MNGPIIAYRGNIGVQTSAPFANTKSIYFDGTDQYLNIGAPSALSNTSNFSISLWVKKGTSSTAYRRIFGKYASASDNIFLGITTTTNYLQLFMANGGATASVVSNVAVSFNVWQNVTVVFDGTLTGNQNRAKIYLDGVNVTATDSGTIPASTTADASDFLLAKVNGLGVNYWLGNMDEFAIFNYSLTQQNVTDIFNLGNPNNLDLLSTPPTNWLRNGDNGAWKSPQWLIPNNENKDKVSNYSFDFDGVDDFIELGVLTDLQNATEYSISCWINTSLIPTYQTIYAWDDGADGHLELMVTSTGVFYVYNYRTATARGLTGSGIISANTWYNATVIFDGSGVTNSDRLKLYINGNLIPFASFDGTIPTQTGTMLISNMKLGSILGVNWFFDGKIDEVSFFNSVIPIGDVWDGSGKPIDVSAVSGITNYWKMGDNSTFLTNWTVPDAVGANDGTSTNMTIEDRIGEASNSTNNALSINMDFADVVLDVP